MIRDAAVLLSHRIVFSDEAKTTEIKKRKLTYDIRQVIGDKAEFERLRQEFKEPYHSPDKVKNKA
jgi:hypothetical protein